MTKNLLADAAESGGLLLLLDFLLLQAPAIDGCWRSAACCYWAAAAATTAAATGAASAKGVKVYLNGKKIPIKSFKDYVDFFIKGRLRI